MRVTGEGGVGIEVFVDGPEDGTPVLFMHGWPDSHDLWRHQIDALAADGYRTIAPGMLGGHPDKQQVIDALAEPGALTASLGWYRANAHPRSLLGGPVDLPRITTPVMGVWSSGDFALTERQMVESKNYVDGPFRYERI